MNDRIVAANMMAADAVGLERHAPAQLIAPDVRVTPGLALTLIAPTAT
jgi:hypothetical protein